jgi:hypothetical protein
MASLGTEQGRKPAMQRGLLKGFTSWRLLRATSTRQGSGCQRTQLPGAHAEQPA